MTKTIKPILWILTATFGIMLSGCGADEPVASNEGKMITIQVGMPQDAETRVAFDGGTLKLTWQTGDKLLVTGYKTDDPDEIATKEYTLVSGVGQVSGSFRGEAIPGAKFYEVRYKNEMGDGIQTQVGNNTTEHLRNHFYIGSYINDLMKPFKLNVNNAIMKLDLTNIPKIGELQNLKWESKDNSNRNVSNSLNFEQVTLGGEVNDLTAYFSFSPNVMPSVRKDSEVKITLTGSAGTYTATKKSQSGKTYDYGTRYTLKLSDWKKQN